MESSQYPAEYLREVISAISQSKRIVVVCGKFTCSPYSGVPPADGGAARPFPGAGISVNAGIPDFRSSEGIFQSLKRDNPDLSSGKDLFDAKVFNSPATTKMFNIMIGNLAGQAADAQPTAFHQLLKTLDDRGKLLRCYTQNIDCLEASFVTFSR